MRCADYYANIIIACAVYFVSLNWNRKTGCSHVLASSWTNNKFILTTQLLLLMCSKLFVVGL